MHQLYELKHRLCDELKQYGGKELSAGSLDVIDKLAHAIKNIDKVIMASEEEEYSRRGYARAEGVSNASNASNATYASYRRSYDGGSNAYRGSYADYSNKRDSMGRYSRDDQLIAELRDLHRAANDEMTRKQIESIISLAENM